MAEEKRQFPTEMVNLPSKGVLYPKESSISKGEIEVKYMTAKEEDILTSQNLIRKGIVIDKLLESLVVDESINLDDILIGDKNALMVASRVLGYGKDYQFELNCPACGERNTDNVDLTKLGEKSIDHSHLKGGKNEFNFDEREIDAELKALKKISGGSNVDPEITTRLKRAIVSVDGKSDTAYVNSFVDNEFLSRDSLAFRNHLLEITPDVDMNYLFTCELCDFDQEVTVPMTVQFFWPSAKR